MHAKTTLLNYGNALCSGFARHGLDTFSPHLTARQPENSWCHLLALPNCRSRIWALGLIPTKWIPTLTSASVKNHDYSRSKAPNAKQCKLLSLIMSRPCAIIANFDTFMLGCHTQGLPLWKMLQWRCGLEGSIIWKFYAKHWRHKCQIEASNLFHNRLQT